ncbi:MAG: FAD-binding protein [Magnetococcales bacterium]|nr:FAD-binding protein [Magnetococcales bacterium]
MCAKWFLTSILTNSPIRFPNSMTLLHQLQQAIGTATLLSHPAELESYAWDNTGIRLRPDAVVLADTAEQVAATLRCCQAAGVAVTPRGAGTGNVGGALPLQGGVVLSLQRMNRIREINRQDRVAVVEPGVVHADLQQALRPMGLCWPPDPTSTRSCTVGGNLAMCAAGASAVRWGVTRDWVLGLEAVTADGRLLRSGGRTTKGVVGYDLTRLLIGSEGTLAVITAATLQLAPRPEARRSLRALFGSVAAAAEAVAQIMAEGETPAAVELLDTATLALLRRMGTLALPQQAQAMLLLEVCGTAATVDLLAADLEQRLERCAPLELQRARSAEEVESIWQARAALSPALKKYAPKRINEDVVVPVSQLAALVTGLERLSHDSGIPMVSFGHAGNGNLHVNLLVNPADQAIMDRAMVVLQQLFALVLSLQGTLSGEHGVGLQKRDFIAQELDPVALVLQQQIKKVFDPAGILNPGKALPLPSS